MRKLAFTLFILLTAVLHTAAQSQQQSFTVETVPNMRLTDVRLHVTDPTSLLSQTTRDTLNTLFTQLENETGIEVAIATLPSIGEADAFDFAHQLFRRWGIGKKKSNNGLLVLYVEDQHTIRFVTGYGLEGTMTDAICKRIQSRYMVPAFKKGNRDAGMVLGAKAICATLKGTMKPDTGNDESDNTILIVLLVMAVVLIALFSAGKLGHKRRCPKCGKKSLVTKSVDYYTLGSQRFRKEVAVCEHCGHVDVRNTKVDNNDNHSDGSGSSFLMGMLLGSLLSGGHRGGGGGGFSGGSFGGGDSGGGGSGSNW